MAAQRRIGGPDAKNRTVLLDAAEQLMLEEGYAAVTSRRVASKAGLKSQLVHYYFRTMDDLFLAMFQRRADEGVVLQRKLLSSDRPLRALWEFSTRSSSTSFTMEFVALSNHRKALKAELARYSEILRDDAIQAVSAAFERYRVPPEVCTPATFVFLVTAVARTAAMEEDLGFSTGHDETVKYIENLMEQLEPVVSV